jgi:hypothetical protein
VLLSKYMSTKSWIFTPLNAGLLVGSTFGSGTLCLLFRPEIKGLHQSFDYQKALAESRAGAIANAYAQNPEARKTFEENGIRFGKSPEGTVTDKDGRDVPVYYLVESMGGNKVRQTSLSPDTSTGVLFQKAAETAAADKNAANVMGR